MFANPLNKFFQKVFLALYNLHLSLKESDIPIFSAVAVLSVLQTLNVYAIGGYILRFNSKTKNYYIALAALILIVNVLIYFKKKKLQEIQNRWETLNKKQKFINYLCVCVYIFSSILVFFLTLRRSGDFL